MSGQKLTLVVAFPEGAPLPRFSFNTPCLGGTVEAFQIGDALAEFRSRLGMLMPADANFDWEEWPGGWPEILSAYETHRDAAAALWVEVEELRGRATTLPEAVCDLLTERRRQDAKWGGPSHDDQLTPLDWHETLADYNGWTRRMAAMGSPDKAYRRAIQTAALALAQAEAIKRRLSAAPQGEVKP